MTDLQLGQEYRPPVATIWDMAPCNLFLVQEQEALDEEFGCKSCGKALHSCPCPDLVAGGVIPAALRFLAGLLGMAA